MKKIKGLGVPLRVGLSVTSPQPLNARLPGFPLQSLTQKKQPEMALEKGKCGECGLSIGPLSYGYCYGCADLVYQRERDRVTAIYPYAVIDGDGRELERHKTEDDAVEHVSALWRSYVKRP